jgi:hypothetical protein
LVVVDEMRHLRSYLGPLEHLIGAVVHLVTVDYKYRYAQRLAGARVRKTVYVCALANQQ